MLNEKEKMLLFSTVRIEVANANAVGTSVGTGFIISVSAPGLADSSYLLLVSNKHVFIDPSFTISLVFTNRNPHVVEPILGATTKLAQAGFSDTYVEHPDASIDLACLNISVLGEPARGLYFRHLRYENLLDDKTEQLSIGQDVFFIGYPENRFDVANNLPLFRKGCIASAPMVDFNKTRQFIIDAPVFQGSSGSPVFAQVGDEFKVSGVISQTMIKNSMLQIIPTTMPGSVQQVIGLGVVLKASLVRELLEHAAAVTSKRLGYISA